MKSSFPWIKLTNENINRPWPNVANNVYTNKFKCQGTARVGCVNMDLNPDDTVDLTTANIANRNTPGTNVAFTKDDIDLSLYVEFPVPTLTEFTCGKALYDANSGDLTTTAKPMYQVGV